MGCIVLERTYDPGIAPESFEKMLDVSGDCLPLYNVEWYESFLAQDGQSLVCVFEADDAESIRMMMTANGQTWKSVWAGTAHDTERDGIPNVVVTRSFDEAVTLDEIQAIEDAGAWCLELHNVTFLRTYFSLDRKRMICLYVAPDAESVRLAQRQAQMPVESVWSCQSYHV